MAMLAEKKRRQKWCLNPRGKQWSDDEMKFGQRLLEKMGWSAGQGLGINKQGPTEIVKVKKKDDSAGLGFKEKGEKWLETTNEYNELLDQLASTEESEKDQADVSSSLEDRSKKSKARVHYHKFTRGKDLCRYSEKDLASIIGPDLVKFKSVDEDYKPNQINKGSSTEYFNSKKSTNHCESTEVESTIKDTTTNEEQAGSSDKKHKKSKKLKEDDTQETNYEIKESPKKSKKRKYNEEQVGDYESYNSKELNSKKISKKKNKILQHEIERETTEHIDELRDTNNSLNSRTDSEGVFEANKMVKKIKSKYLTESEVDHSTYKLSKNNIQNLENNCTSNIDSVNKEEIKEENVVSKKKKKVKQHNVEVIDDVEKPEFVENENFKKKVSKKRKTENNDAINDGIESDGVKRKKGKRENSESLNHEEPDNVLNSEIDSELPSKEKLPKHSKKRNKSKDQSILDTEVNDDLKASEKLLNINKENKFHSEMTTDNNEEITSKASSECLTVFGRKTRLKNLNINRNPAKHEKFATEEFMAFNESKNTTSTKNSVCESHRNSKNGSCQRIYVEPNNEDSNISMNVANYEYRLLTSKLKLLKISSGDVKIVIKNNALLPKKLQKKLKLLYKSKYYKSLLPEDEVAGVEASVEELAAKLQPKIDVINELLEIENRTVELANETSVVLSDNKEIDQNNLSPEKKETLKEMKKQLKLLSKVGKSTNNGSSKNNEELTDKKRSKMDTSNSKYKKGKVSSGGELEEVTAPVESLQTRIDERLKVLAEQMRQLAEKRKLPADNNSSPSKEGKSTSRWGSGRQERLTNTSNQTSACIKTKEDSSPNYGRSGRGVSSRGQSIRSSWRTVFGLGHRAERMQGQGGGTVLRGRISKNNFDAKQYALKCKFKKILPEITFKGVDLKVISGYAANDTSGEQSAIEPSSHKTNS